MVGKSFCHIVQNRIKENIIKENKIIYKNKNVLNKDC